MEFRQILSTVMKILNLNQSQLADKLHLKPSQISEWLSGKSKPGYDNLKNISEALGISADILLGIKSITQLENPKPAEEFDLSLYQE